MTCAEEAEFWQLIRRNHPGEPIGSEQDSPAPGAPADPHLALIGGRPEPEVLRDLEPSGLLLDMLDALDEQALDDLDRYSDLALLDVVAAWQRLASMASAGAARAAAALSRRECVQVPDGPVPVGRGHRRYTTLRATGTEIAIRTGCTVRSGELLARDGRLFDGVLAATGSALARGHIDPRKARAIADRLVDLPLETALDVQARVLPGAGLRSPAQLDRDLTRALVEVDATEATARHQRARAGRRVCHPSVLPDGMSGMWAVLPAESAALLDAALDASAASARAAGDPRSTDQLRADGLVDLVVGTGDASGPVGHGTVHVDVTVALSTLLGLDDAPGELAGYGAITAEQAAALAAGGALRRLVTDPLSGAVLDVGRSRYRPPAALRTHVIARDKVCARPGCVVPAQRAEIDHTVPFGPTPLVGTTELLGTTGGVEPSRSAGAPAPASPPCHGEARRPTGPPQGDTKVENLAPLCAPDHLAKTLGVMHLEQPSPGVLEWTTATGLRVQVVPGRDGQASLLPDRPPHTPARGASERPPPF